jgi:hypothetical protein
VDVRGSDGRGSDGRGSDGRGSDVRGYQAVKKKAAKRSPYEFSVSVRGYSTTLLSVALVLLAIHVGLTIYHYTVEELPWLLRQFFDVDEEENFPTWYSSFLLLNPAFFAWLCARRRLRDREPWAGHWGVLAGVFLILSFDEVAGLHETINSATELSWAVPAGVAVGGFALAFFPFLLRLPRRTALLFVASGVLYVGGAVGVELATDFYAEEKLMDTLAYNLWTPVEEGLEMLGVVLFVFALLDYMGPDGRAGVTVKVGD